jgi:hypothetical protein
MFILGDYGDPVLHNLLMKLLWLTMEILSEHLSTELYTAFMTGPSTLPIIGTNAFI